jgi:hypothetical protein
MQTRSKILKALTLEELEQLMNLFFESEANAGRELEIKHVNQLQIGEADTKTVTMTGQPQVKYYFVAVIFYQFIQYEI